MTDCRSQHIASSASEQRRVIVTVAQVKGSAPREEGAQLLVFDDSQSGTIGGGCMEHDAVQQARAMLGEGTRDAFNRLSRKRLEPRYDQCCGGVVVLLFEYIPTNDVSVQLVSRLDSRMHQLDSERESYSLITLGSFEKNLAGCRILVTECEVICEDDLDLHFAQEVIQTAKERLSRPTDKHNSELLERKGNEFWIIRVIRSRTMHITLFGAGHVGQALVQTLSAYDCSIRWIDNRRDIFPENVSQNIQCITTKTPAAEVGDAASNSYFLVMTHSHSLDYEICDHILARDDFVYLGLIGSKSKALRFAQQFKRQGLTVDELAKITCPIGIDGIQSKKASAIAISVAAQLLQLHEVQQVRGIAEHYTIDSLSQKPKKNTGGRYAGQQ